MRTAFDLPATHQPPSTTHSKGNTDILDQQLFEKADLDYIPGLDYDLGPVFIPSEIDQSERFSFDPLVVSLVALDNLPPLDPAAQAAAKAKADEAARKKEAEAAAEAEARRKEQARRPVKPILPYSSMFIFSSTNP